ncbi:MAG: DUF167 domain-containing protein [Anaerolineales bacterium]|nr:DUF167 domain-containing protein [Anaerolineales bacterium]
MQNRKYKLHDGKRGAALAVRITPRATKSKIVQVTHDGTIKIHVAAPLEEDLANEELVNFLSEILGVSSSALEVVAGETGRDKLVSVLDMDADTLHEKIIKHIG